MPTAHKTAYIKYNKEAKWLRFTLLDVSKKEIEQEVNIPTENFDENCLQLTLGTDGKWIVTTNNKNIFIDNK